MSSADVIQPDDPTPDEQRRRYEERGGDDELAGTVFVVDGEVKFAGPMTVLGVLCDVETDPTPGRVEETACLEGDRQRQVA